MTGKQDYGGQVGNLNIAYAKASATKEGGEKMKQSELIRWGGLVGMIGAVLLIVGSVIHPPVESPETIVTQNWVWAHAIGAKGILLLLLGVTAIYLKMAERAGKLGLLAFVLTFAGLAQIMFIYSFAAMIEPALVSSAPQLLSMNGPLFQGLFGLFFMSTVVLFIVGLVLFGYSVWQTNKTKWWGALIILGALPLGMIFVNPETPELVYNIGFIVANAGFFGLSRQVWSMKS
jgi:hypothetical protein